MRYATGTVIFIVATCIGMICADAQSNQREDFKTCAEGYIAKDVSEVYSWMAGQCKRDAASIGKKLFFLRMGQEEV